MCKSVVRNLECIFPWEQDCKWRLGSQARGWKQIYSTAYSARLLIALSSIRETETCGLTLFWVAGPAKGQGLFVWDLIWFRRGLNLGNHKASFICISNKAIS